LAADFGSRNPSQEIHQLADAPNTTNQETLSASVSELCKRARAASRLAANLRETEKNFLLQQLAEEMSRPPTIERLLQANDLDVEAGRQKGLSGALLDRLSLTPKRIDGMVSGLREVISLPDPVGIVRRMWTRPNGLRVGKRTIPLGVIGIIYEARPNVTVDAFSLCFKAGNATVLKGGSEALNSNQALVDVISGVLSGARLGAACQLLASTERRAVSLLLQQDEWIDLIIPRGGEGLIRFVTENSRIPVIRHYKGVCHVYVDESADLEMALKIVHNAKTSRPAVCNALETLLVHEGAASRFLPAFHERMRAENVEVRADEEARRHLRDALPAGEDDFYAEFLDLILAVRVVKSLDEAIEHIEKYGSSHTEAIITQDYSRAQEFLDRVNSSVVLVNASTRFSDGGELGLGAEIGISTSKLHAYGPMGLESLVTEKFIVYGNGQVRT
jgi:glutamate-5-semialdehyde dehydrogenase